MNRNQVSVMFIFGLLAVPGCAREAHRSSGAAAASAQTTPAAAERSPVRVDCQGPGLPCALADTKPNRPAIDPRGGATPAVRTAFGLTQLTGDRLERVMIPSASRQRMMSAWRLEIACDQGRGAIVLLDDSPSDAQFVGDGVFAGWSQERLSKIYKALIEARAGGGSSFDVPQLG
jgi:hypothetical protein